MDTLAEDVLHEIITHTFTFVPMKKYFNVLWSQERYDTQRRQIAWRPIHEDIRKRQHMREPVSRFAFVGFEDFSMEGYEHLSMEEAENIIEDENMYKQEQSAVNTRSILFGLKKTFSNDQDYLLY